MLLADPNERAAGGAFNLVAEPHLIRAAPHAGGVVVDPDPWAVIRIIAVECLPYREHFSNDVQSVERTFIVDWKRRKEFVDTMLGSADIVANLIADPFQAAPDPRPTVNPDDFAANEASLRGGLFAVVSEALPLLGPGALNNIVTAVIRVARPGGIKAEVIASIREAAIQAVRAEAAVFNAAINPVAIQGAILDADIVSAITAIVEFMDASLPIRPPPPAAPPNMIVDEDRPWRLSRRPPAQDPEYGYEHLYCSDCELIEPIGVMGFNNDLFARAADGSPLMLETERRDGVRVNVVAPGGVLRPAFIIPLPKIVMRSDDNLAQVAGFNVAQLPQTPGFGWGRYRCTFTPRPYTVLGDAAIESIAGARPILHREMLRFVERYSKPAIQAIPRPGIGGQFGKLVWLEGPNPGDSSGLENAGVILMHTEEVHWTVHELPELPRAAMRNVMGKINVKPVDDINDQLYEAGTLLCQAPTWERKRFSNGRVYYTLRYSFLWRPQSWERLPHASDGNFYKVGYVVNGVTHPIYEKVSFDQLFETEPPHRHEEGG